MRVNVHWCDGNGEETIRFSADQKDYQCVTRCLCKGWFMKIDPIIYKDILNRCLKVHKNKPEIF